MLVVDVSLLCCTLGWPSTAVATWQIHPGTILGLQSHMTSGMQPACVSLGGVRAKKQGSVSLYKCTPTGEMHPLFLQLSVKAQLRREKWACKRKQTGFWTHLMQVISTSEETNEEKHEEGEGNLQLMLVCW